MTLAISNNNAYETKYSSSSVRELESKLQEAKDKQGVFGSIWNGVKEFTGIGTSETKCESKLEDYKEGKISFEEAVTYIESFEQKQENMTELGKNLLTGTAAIATTVATGGTSLPAILALGGATGAVAKTALGVIDRATNKVDGDEWDSKELVEDAISGTVTGAASALPSKPFGEIKVIKNIENPFSKAVATQAACAGTCGLVSGSTSYLTNVALDDDKDFDLGDFTSATLTSGLVSSVVGAGFGAFQNTTTGQNITNNIKGLAKGNEVGEKIASDSAASGTRKILGRMTKDVTAI